MANGDDADVVDQAAADETADERATRLDLEQAQRYGEEPAPAERKPFQPVEAAPAARKPFQPVTAQPAAAVPPAPAAQDTGRQPFQPLGTPAQAAAAQQGW